LCKAAFGTLWTYDGAYVHAVALHNVPPVFAEFLTRAPHRVGPDSAHGRLLRGEAVVHITDIVAEQAYQLGDPIRRALVDLGGGRALLAVPLRKDDTFVGDFVIYRAWRYSHFHGGTAAEGRIITRCFHPLPTAGRAVRR
jgi:two-component system NtrC family sensor kinase